MADSPMTAITDQLKEEENRLQAEQQQLGIRLKEIASDLARVRQALKALGDPPRTKATRKPAASQQEVQQAAVAVLTEQGVLEEQSLKTAVEQRLVQAGRSRMGLALHLQQVLTKPGFIETPAGYRLADEAEQTAEQPSVTVESSGLKDPKVVS